jgi:hypothetical protein
MFNVECSMFNVERMSAERQLIEHSTLNIQH